nr:hypothetical protein [Microbacterium lacticum]
MRGAGFEELEEQVTIPYAGVIGVQREERAHQEHRRLVIVVSRILEGLVQRRHQLRGLDGRGLLRLRPERALTVASKEGEAVRVVPQLSERELLHPVVLSVEVEQAEPVKVTREDPTRNLRVREIVDVVEGLLLGRDEIFTRRLHFDQRETGDQGIDVPAGASRGPLNPLLIEGRTGLSDPVHPEQVPNE